MSTAHSSRAAGRRGLPALAYRDNQPECDARLTIPPTTPGGAAASRCGSMQQAAVYWPACNARKLSCPPCSACAPAHPAAPPAARGHAPRAAALHPAAQGQARQPSRTRSGAMQVLWDTLEERPWGQQTQVQLLQAAQPTGSAQARELLLCQRKLGWPCSRSAQWQPNAVDLTESEWPVPNDQPINPANWLLTSGNSGGSSRFMALSSARKRAFSLGVTCQGKKLRR